MGSPTEITGITARVESASNALLTLISTRSKKNQEMLDIKPFKQRATYCGPAALKMVLDFYGVKKSEKELAKLAGHRPSTGVGAESLVKAARQLGFRGAIKDFASLDDIRKYVLRREIPVIVDWFSRDEGHYSVVADINKKYIYLQDPELAAINKIDLKTFKRVWFDFPGDFLSSPDDLIIRRLIAIYPG